MLSRRVLLVTVMSMLVLPGCSAVAPGFDVLVLDAGPDAHIDVAHNLDAGPMDIVEMTTGCLASQTMCDGRCTSTMVDTNNCGACGHACGEEQACYAGVCHTACPTGLSACGGGDAGADLCVDLQDSRLNCGACGHVCPPQATCSAGTCILDCGTRTVCRPGGSGDAGTSDAGGDPYCTDLTFDPMNCGACGAACPPSYLCQAGSCVIDCVYPQVGCPPDATHTMSFCSNHNTDPMNCGTCGHTCPSGQTCTGGTCVCMAPQLACGAACVDPRSDPMNCGTCGHACTAGQYCSAGACVLCAPRTLCPAGVCTDTQTDATNCGTCGTVCPTGNVCQAGACICPTGSMVCSGTCVNTQYDPNNCGTCAHVCPLGMGCSMGTCGTTTRYMQQASPVGVAFLDACTAAGSMTYLPNADDSNASVALPFAFRYWTNNITSGSMINITSNGFISMDGIANSSLGGTVPSTIAPNAVIAPHWGDNHNGVPGQCVATFGTAPNRKWVVEWTNDYYCCTAGTTSLTYEVILTETTNTIDFVFGTMNGVRAETMGLENFTGAIGLNACPGGTGSCAPATGQTIRFIPIP